MKITLSITLVILPNSDLKKEFLGVVVGIVNEGQH
ncbi:hypothetical protein DERP_005550, partial [Dermatophagoides pteronyssinus]